MSQPESAITITTVDMATEEHEDDDSDLDDVMKSSYEKTEFRLGIVGVIFIIAGALFLIVPGTMTKKSDDNAQSDKNSSGFFITGGVMFGLGAMMISINVFWCLNEQKILRDMEKAKEKKAQEKHHRSPQCAYHSLPQPEPSPCPGGARLSPGRPGPPRYPQPPADIEVYHPGHELDNSPEGAGREDGAPNGAVCEGGAESSHSPGPPHPSPDPPHPSPTTYDNPSYLSDTRM